MWGSGTLPYGHSATRRLGGLFVWTIARALSRAILISISSWALRLLSVPAWTAPFWTSAIELVMPISVTVKHLRGLHSASEVSDAMTTKLSFWFFRRAKALWTVYFSSFRLGFGTAVTKPLYGFCPSQRSYSVSSLLYSQSRVSLTARVTLSFLMNGCSSWSTWDCSSTVCRCCKRRSGLCPCGSPSASNGCSSHCASTNRSSQWKPFGQAAGRGIPVTFSIWFTYLVFFVYLLLFTLAFKLVDRPGPRWMWRASGPELFEDEAGVVRSWAHSDCLDVFV